MNVTLIRPPKLIVQGGIGTGASTTSSPFPTAPLGIALIASVIRNMGHSVTVIDGVAEGPVQYNDIDVLINSENFPKSKKLITQGISAQEIFERIPPNTDVIGFSCMFTHNWLADRALIKFLSQKLPKAIIIAGGESITGMSVQCLNETPGLKVCVLGEGEETIEELLNALENNTDLGAVNGIIYKTSENELIKTPKRNRLRDLNSLPLASWDLLPIDNYEKQGRFSGDIPRVSLPILSTRGCPYTCTFCTSPDMWGTRYFMRTPTHVADEMQMMKEKYNVTNFEFYDLTAIIQRKWIIELAKILIDRDLDIFWRIPSGTRSEAIDDEVADHLRRSGCYFITYAPESGSPRLLDIIHKKVKLDSMLESMTSSYRNGLKVFINMIQGLPGETHSDVWKTIFFLIRCAKTGVHEISLGTFRPYPGTVLLNELVEQKKIHFDNDDYYVHILLTIETEESFYNDNVSSRWYSFYNKLMIFSFFASSYIYFPSRFIKSVKNIRSNQSDSRFEKTILYYKNKAKLRFSPIP